MVYLTVMIILTSLPAVLSQSSSVRLQTSASTASRSATESQTVAILATSYRLNATNLQPGLYQAILEVEMQGVAMNQLRLPHLHI